MKDAVKSSGCLVVSTPLHSDGGLTDVRFGSVVVAATNPQRASCRTRSHCLTLAQALVAMLHVAGMEPPPGAPVPPAAAQPQQQSGFQGPEATSPSAAALTMASLRDLFYFLAIVMRVHVEDGASSTGGTGVLQGGVAAGVIAPTEDAIDLCLAAMHMLRVRCDEAAP